MQPALVRSHYGSPRMVLAVRYVIAKSVRGSLFTALRLGCMRRRFILISAWPLIIVAVFTHHLLGQDLPHEATSFACSSSHYMLADFERQPTVSSPDKIKAVQFTKKEKFRVTVGERIISDFGLPGVSSNIEIGWSPDSSAFFISYSDGGAIGGYHVKQYRFIGNTLKESTVPTTIAKRFETRHWCESRGNNLFFLGWTPDSKFAVFVAEVYPTGDCGTQAGDYEGYVVRLRDGKVLQILSKARTDSIEKKCRASGRLVLPSE